FELVLPPPKLVMRRSAPSRFDRYRSRFSGSPASAAAAPSSHRLLRSLVPAAAVSGTGALQVVDEAAILRVPPLRFRGLEALDRKRSLDDRARLVERAARAGAEHLDGDVAERGRLDRAGEHRPAGRVGGELVEQPVARPAADDADLFDAAAGQLFEAFE